MHSGFFMEILSCFCVANTFSNSSISSSIFIFLISALIFDINNHREVAAVGILGLSSLSSEMGKIEYI